MKNVVLYPFVGLLAVLCFSQCTGKKPAPQNEKLNVLFIAVDDLRPELNCYGAHQIKSPNFDRLSAISTQFNQAYCQQAVCAPSRNSILTGLRPDVMGIYDLYTFFRRKVPEVTTLPQHFKAHGYITERIGKIYHTGHGNKDDSLSWSNPPEKLWRPEEISHGDTIGLERDFPAIDGKKLPYYKSPMPEGNMTDATIADHAVQRLKNLKDSSFFLAVGFIKPHLPFVAPQQYWDLYDPAEIIIPERKSPEGMPEMALHQFGELRKYHNIPVEGYLSDETSKNLIHGYYAATSFIDAQLGKLLDALESEGLSKNTIIVLWGDHGWKLGDYGGWCKHTNFELDTRVPLFIYDPGNPEGQKTNSLAELVDIYPTLCAMAGLPAPAHLEGQNLVPILENPEAKVNQVAISQYPRGENLDYDRKKTIMGYSMRYENFRFTRWQNYEKPNEVIALELYDHSKSPLAEKNLADLPEYQEKVKELDGLLSAELGKYQLNLSRLTH
ncbi:sulfatase [Flexithrix dorotheae]|uniref:sulfatase n=1 Tax=Flexithrix dorotheae TaxID=70993 RepID=UPI00037851C1|nr:sulfatase [Flexithrix dorotheae]